MRRGSLVFNARGGRLCQTHLGGYLGRVLNEGFDRVHAAPHGVVELSLQVSELRVETLVVTFELSYLALPLGLAHLVPVRAVPLTLVVAWSAPVRIQPQRCGGGTLRRERARPFAAICDRFVVSTRALPSILSALARALLLLLLLRRRRRRRQRRW